MTSTLYDHLLESKKIIIKNIDELIARSNNPEFHLDSLIFWVEELLLIDSLIEPHIRKSKQCSYNFYLSSHSKEKVELFARLLWIDYKIKAITDKDGTKITFVCSENVFDEIHKKLFSILFRDGYTMYRTEI